jgi:hypothetical protein
MTDTNPQARVTMLQARGVTVFDPAQVYVGSEVCPERIAPGSILFPGTRLHGSRTFLAPRSKVGSEGPATVIDSVLGEEAEIASGYIANSVVLNGARLGSNAHVRPGTLLEEYASTAHAVGLKQTILLAYVTVGSLVNLCDVLVSGGRSRNQHSEIGSGFIHFNYTPYGQEGDKATPTLIGDVERGVFLREEKIFLGGLSGIVGPRKVGFGAFTVAGQVVREDVAESRIYSSVGRALDKIFSRIRQQLPADKVASNIEFIGQLFALKAWYSRVRLARTAQMENQWVQNVLISEALFTIEDCIAERTLRLNALLRSFGYDQQDFEVDLGECPISLDSSLHALQHLDWLRSLSDSEVSAGQAWLHRVSSSIRPCGQT